MGKERGIVTMWIAGLFIDGGQGSKVILEDIGRFPLVLVFFLQSLQLNIIIMSQSRTQLLFPHPFVFTMYWSLYNSVLYSLKC